ncbi:MAG TPA: GGDEF domain-containing protein [Acidimicrobiales bacterium]|nr:GGDEF domain-containing protein [Acidimicrobiales bacterium]
MVSSQVLSSSLTHDTLLDRGISRAPAGAMEELPRRGAASTLLALVAHVDELVLAVARDGRITAVVGGSATTLAGEIAGTSVFEHCHPSDLDSVRAFAREGLATTPGWEGVGAVRLRVASGGWRFHDVRVLNCLDDPAIRGFVLHVRESTGDGAADCLLDGVERELETLAGVVPLPILFLDQTGAMRFANAAARDLCSHLLPRLGEEGLVGVADLRDRALVEQTIESVAQSGGERTISFRLLPPRPSAPERVVEATFGARGDALGIVATLVDVSAHHARESELRRMASCDPLTGLLNRVEIEEALAERLRRAPERVALLYCDLDGFKAVNDTHGHDAGDELLVEIAQVLESKTRPGDLVGRLGGDEFAVLLDSEDPSDAHGLACRIAVAIAELSSYRRLPVSASVGAATARRGDSTRDLLRRADAAMYDEKRRRRLETGTAR